MNWIKPPEDALQMAILGTIIFIIALCFLAVGMSLVEKIKEKRIKKQK